MKKILCATVAAAALMVAAGSASAADMAARPMYTKAPPAPMYNWTGAYIGINGGGGWGSTGAVDGSGGFVGGTLGYNWQQGMTVFGLETDIAWSGIEGTSTIGAASVTAGSDWFGTVRGRLGIAQDRALWFVSGGLAYGNVHATAPGFVGVDDTNAGWTLGGGVEFALQGPWTAKVEYLHVNLGDVTPVGLGVGSQSFDADLVRAGLNYRF
jgi:outer membrane immunogenic protein